MNSEEWGILGICAIVAIVIGLSVQDIPWRKVVIGINTVLFSVLGVLFIAIVLSNGDRSSPFSRTVINIIWLGLSLGVGFLISILVQAIKSKAARVIVSSVLYFFVAIILYIAYDLGVNGWPYG